MNRITDDDLRRNYYKLLGVDPEAHPAIIKNAYRTNMSELNAHPDRGGTTEKAILLNRAREVLLDAALRREYDQRRTADRGSHPGSAATEKPRPDTSRGDKPDEGATSSESPDRKDPIASLRRWLPSLV